MKKLFCGVAALLLMACSAKTETLDGSYVLQAAPNGAPITLTLDAGHYSGKSGVNNYFGSYTTAGNGVIHFEPGGLTMMMGPAEHMEAERAYLAQLFAVENYAFNNHLLVLSGTENSSLTFKRAE